ncbi:MAG: hypothetical protein HY400_05465 [Elusimicrobia bacterium]|nr:hypothetical protein [Elusimicrobiota bacterium]
MKIILFVTSIILFLQLPLRASHISPPMSFGFSDYATYQDPIMILNSYGFPTNPLQKGARQLKITPAYITSFSKFSQGFGQSLDTLSDGGFSGGNTTFSENDAKGGGVVVSWLQGLTDHWGYSVSAAFMRLSGKTFALAEYDSGHNLIKRHDADEKGTTLQVSGTIIYDPFTDPEGFRLPLFVGYGFLYQNQSADYSAPVSVLAGNTVSYKNSFKELIPGFVLGASLQFNTGPFRWAPFFAIQLKNVSPSVENIVTNETTGAVLKSQNFTNSDSFLPTGGVGLQYRPWGLDFRWAPNLVALGEWEFTNSSVFTLTKTFKFNSP